MSGFLTRLVDRTLGLAAPVQPVLASRYEPAPDSYAGADEATGSFEPSEAPASAAHGPPAPEPRGWNQAEPPRAPRVAREGEVPETPNRSGQELPALPRDGGLPVVPDDGGAAGPPALAPPLRGGAPPSPSPQPTLPAESPAAARSASAGDPASPAPAAGPPADEPAALSGQARAVPLGARPALSPPAVENPLAAAVATPGRERRAAADRNEEWREPPAAGPGERTRPGNARPAEDAGGELLAAPDRPLVPDASPPGNRGGRDAMLLAAPTAAVPESGQEWSEPRRARPPSSASDGGGSPAAPPPSPPSPLVGDRAPGVGPRATSEAAGGADTGPIAAYPSRESHQAEPPRIGATLLPTHRMGGRVGEGGEPDGPTPPRPTEPPGWSPARRDADRAAPPAPTVRVSIGRIEVRAVQPPSSPAPPAPPPAGPPPGPRVSLEEYLRERDARQGRRP